MGVLEMFRQFNQVSNAFIGTMLAAGLGCAAVATLSGCDQAPAATSTENASNVDVSNTSATDQQQTAPTPAPAPTVKPRATPVAINPAMPGNTPGAKLVFDSLIYDFGTVYTAGALKGTYDFKNEGTADLLVTRVKPGCGCTSSNAAELENTTYKPGAGGQIKFTFNPKGQGQQNKTITVVSTNEEQSTIYLQLRANVLPSVKIMASAAQFGNIRAGESGKAVIQLQSRDPEFYVKDILLPDDTQLTWTFERLEGHPDAEYPGVGQVVFKSNANSPTGPISEQTKIQVYAKVPEVPDQTDTEFRAVVGGNILAKFSFEPRFLRFPTSSPGDVVEARTIISHLEGNAFKILKVEFDKTGSPGDDFTLSFEEVAGSEGKMHEVILRGTCPPLGRSFRGAIYVYSDVENHGPVTLRYNGIIRPIRK